MREILFTMESLRNESTYEHNAKHGATRQYGVKLGDIRQIAKAVEKNNTVALQLWETGIADAQLLATLIVKPKELSAEDLDKMVHTTHFSQVADWFTAYLLKNRSDKFSLYERWIKDRNKWAQRAAWSLLAGFVSRKEYALDLNKVLKDLASKMPKAAPEVQWTMNTTLAQIGIHHEEYRQRAIDLGEEIGLYKDYPTAKGCTSPFVPVWIREMANRQDAESKVEE